MDADPNFNFTRRMLVPRSGGENMPSAVERLLLQARRAEAKLAGGVSHRTTIPSKSSPGGAAERGSPQEPFVVFDAATFQEREVFFLERKLPMMIFLVRNVSDHRRALRWADGERSIPFLPRERALVDFLMYPPRRNRLHIAHHIRETCGGFQANEQMHVILHAAHRFRNPTDIANHAAKIGVETGPPIRRDGRRAAFGAEHDVVVKREVGRGHGAWVPAPLPGRVDVFYRFRWLTPPANFQLALRAGN